MKRLLWWLLTKFDNNHGYSTPLQKRYNVGDTVRINKDTCTEYTQEFIGGGEIKIIEIGRHDYLIGDNLGKRIVVYQYELH